MSGCASKESSKVLGSHQPSEIQSSAFDSGMLIGLWKIENMAPSDFFQYKYVEIKDREICVSWSETDIMGFECNQYMPYIIEGNIIKVGSPPGPFYKADFANGKLELETVSKAVPQKKRTYTKVK